MNDTIDTCLQVKEVWKQKKVDDEKRRAEHKEAEALPDYLRTFLLGRFGLQSLMTENAYNFYDSLKKYKEVQRAF